jgi:Flp pilus assembly protein TadG
MKMNCSLGLRSSQAGQSLVEVALVTPLLLLLLLGAVEMGRFAYLGILVGNAARAGAGYASQSTGHVGDGSGICNAASYDFQGSTDSGCSSVSSSGGASSGTSTGSAGTVTVASSAACWCDSNGTLTQQPSCTAFGAGKCSSGAHWAITVSVTVSGSFSSLFKFPGIPQSVAISRTSTIRVAQ